MRSNGTGWSRRHRRAGSADGRPTTRPPSTNSCTSSAVINAHTAVDDREAHVAAASRADEDVEHVVLLDEAELVRGPRGDHEAERHGHDPREESPVPRATLALRCRRGRPGRACRGAGRRRRPRPARPRRPSPTLQPRCVTDAARVAGSAVVTSGAFGSRRRGAARRVPDRRCSGAAAERGPPVLTGEGTFST